MLARKFLTYKLTVNAACAASPSVMYLNYLVLIVFNKLGGVLVTFFVDVTKRHEQK